MGEHGRMRIRHGRVMHLVERDGVGYRSLCQRASALRGLTIPRARGPVDEWSAERRWYPDCAHCPAEPGRVAT